MNTFTKIAIPCGTACILYVFSHQLGWISYPYAWLIFIISQIVIFWTVNYFSAENIRKRSITEASWMFRVICKKIVNYQRTPSNTFDKDDLQKVLGLTLPKPVENTQGNDVYTFTLNKNFNVAIIIKHNYMDVGGGTTYRDFEFTHYSFGSCQLLETQTECANFDYKTRYIYWQTTEFKEANNCTTTGYEYLKNQKQAADELFDAKLKYDLDIIEANNNFKRRVNK